MHTRLPLSALEDRDEFVARHIGPNPDEMRAMLDALDVFSLDALIDETVPSAIRLPAPPALPVSRSRRCRASSTATRWSSPRRASGSSARQDCTRSISSGE